ncbi:hypothetical protein EMCRGX_G021395 [Ephydatia muelleri]
MAKDRGVEVGDWSESGTFLRKPVSGWLHDDRDLMNSGITYKIHYLGCIEVKSSMRTLQYQTRIQVTKEAITRLAENAQRVAQNKKRKLPKMLQKLLGELDTHWAGDVNLSISVESLKICAKSNREIMNHSLPSISFASGGDEATANFIGYVAKDPIHERACHVFECEDSQYVLTTIGQAFELRYKMYLLNPQGGVARSGGSATSPTNEPPPLATPNAPPTAPRRGAEQLAVPKPPPPSANPSKPPPPSANPFKPPSPSANPSKPPSPSANPRPTASPQIASGAPLKLAQAITQIKQLNIYDSTQEPAPSGFTETGDYSNPGEITDTHPAIEDYVPDTTFKTVRQMGPRDEDDIDLTPSGMASPDEFQPPRERLAIYANTLEMGSFDDGDIDGLAIYTNTLDSDHVTSSKATPYNSGMYDDPGSLDITSPSIAQKVSSPSSRHRVPSPPAVRKVPSPPPARKVASPLVTRKVPSPPPARKVPSPPPARKVPSPPPARKVPSPPPARKVPSPVVAQPQPKFDDTIYAKRVDGPVGVSAGGPVGVPVSQPIRKMKYFHGTVNRIEAEAMLERDGDFMVRESGKQPGQYVLTGMGGGSHSTFSSLTSRAR